MPCEPMLSASVHVMHFRVARNAIWPWHNLISPAQLAPEVCLFPEVDEAQPHYLGRIRSAFIEAPSHSNEVGPGALYCP